MKEDVDEPASGLAGAFEGDGLLAAPGEDLSTMERNEKPVEQQRNSGALAIPIRQVQFDAAA